MKWVLIVVLLSSGLDAKSFSTEDECRDALIEYLTITKTDLWHGVCVGPYDEGHAIVRDIGP